MRPSNPQEVLGLAKIDAFLVSNPLHIRYLSGVNPSVALLLITPRRFVLFVDVHYRAEAEKNVRKGIYVRDIDDLERVMREIKECGFESDHVTVLQKARWTRIFQNTKFVQKTGVLQEFRRRKEKDELLCLRRAQRITHEMLRRVPSALRKEVTEEKLARQLLVWALELGADGLSFDPIVAFGTHTASPHHQPTSRSLQKGHLVQIDVGAKYRGYCADCSRVFFTVTPTDAQKKVYDILCDVQAKAVAATKAGASTAGLDKMARDMLRKHGLDKAFTHSLGHGVGLEIHEGPTLSSKRADSKLLPGEVVTIEPGVYFEGKFGMRVEDMVFVA